jgi:cystathionine gamma-synthase/methionine-gamma-lyase
VQALVPHTGRILSAVDIYGATHALFHQQLIPSGYQVEHASTEDLDEFRTAALRFQPSVIYIESISNPLIKVANVARIAEIADEAGALLVLDNTFASPVVIRALPLGVDVVIYSSTKHLSGHGDSTGGLVATSTELAERLHQHRKFAGAILSPFDAWLTLRGMRTLHLRVRQQSLNAEHLAEWLGGRSGIERVYYPSRTSEASDATFVGDLRGSMLAFDIADASRSDAFAFQDALRLIEPATTLGDVQTLVLHPATTSHRPLSDDQRRQLGIGEGLIRLSAGIEDPGDIIADLDRALVSIGR